MGMRPLGEPEMSLISPHCKHGPLLYIHLVTNCEILYGLVDVYNRKFEKLCVLTYIFSSKFNS